MFRDKLTISDQYSALCLEPTGTVVKGEDFWLIHAAVLVIDLLASNCCSTGDKICLPLTAAVLVIDLLASNCCNPGFNTRCWHERWSCGHLVRQVGLYRVLQVPRTGSAYERIYRCQREYFV